MLVGIETDEGPAPDAGRLVEELVELARSAGLEPAGSVGLRVRRPNATTLVGRGQADAVRALAASARAQVVVLDADLAPSQQRNLEEILKVKTIDRTQLILDIFAQRARSTEGKLQVELAQLKYLLPRLGGQGIYLSRLGGGVGTRGPGEQKLEMDRRRIRERVTRLERDLERLRQRRERGMRKRREADWPVAALVGYTNAGKSTLFNALTEAAVLVKDQLFSTLDTTTRSMTLPGRRRALVIDTVGFIRNLPHHLVESFRATLEEAVDADLVVHVEDASRPDTPQLRAAVESVLRSLGVDPSAALIVRNKADLPAAGPASGGEISISAKTGEGMEALRGELARRLFPDHSEKEYWIPTSKLGLLPALYEQAQIRQRQDGPDGVRVFALMSARSHGWLTERLTR